MRVYFIPVPNDHTVVAIFLNHFEKEFHLVLSRAAHVSVLLGEVVDHGDQVKADQPHAQHPLTLLEGKMRQNMRLKRKIIEQWRSYRQVKCSILFCSVVCLYYRTMQCYMQLC